MDITEIHAILSVLNKTGGKFTFEFDAVPGFLDVKPEPAVDSGPNFDDLKAELLAGCEDELEASDMNLLKNQWISDRQVASYFEIDAEHPTRKVQRDCKAGLLYYRTKGRRYEICSLSCVLRVLGRIDPRVTS